MKNLKDKIFESSVSDTELDKSIERSEKKKVQNAIYKQFEKTGTTSRYYKDDMQEALKLVKKDIQDAFKTIENTEHEYEVYMVPMRRLSTIDQSPYGEICKKRYKVEIFVKGAKLPFMCGTLNCYPSGTINCVIVVI